MVTNVLISLMAFSGLGMVILFGKQLIEVRKLEKEELARKVDPAKLSFKCFCVAVFRFIKNIFKNIFIPFFYKVTERIIFGLGLFIKRIEKILLKLDNRIRGKYRVIKNNNNGNSSKYWGDVVDFKNGLDGNGDKPE